MSRFNVQLSKSLEVLADRAVIFGAPLAALLLAVALIRV